MATTATPIAIFPKDPAEMLDFAIDWTKWLRGDTISASTWAVPAGLTGNQTAFGAGLTIVWLSVGVDGTNYLVSNTIITVGGRTAKRTVQIQVRQR